MGSVPQKIDLETGADNWDAAAEANFDLLLKSPRPLFQHTGDETDLEATYPAAAWEQCSVWVDHTVLGRIIYWSNGTVWAPMHQPKSRALARWQSCDFSNHTGTVGEASPFTVSTLVSGVVAQATLVGMQGGLRITGNSAGSANSGGAVVTASPASVLCDSGIAFAGIFAHLGALADRTVRVGILSTTNHTDTTNGIYFEFSSGTWKGKCAAASTRTATADTYTPTLATTGPDNIYILGGRKMSASLVEFWIYDVAAGVYRLQDQVTTNIPSVLTGAGIVATKDTAVAGFIGTIDYLGFGPELPVEFRP